VKLVCPSIYGGRKAGLKYTNGGLGSSGDSSWICSQTPVTLVLTGTLSLNSDEMPPLYENHCFTIRLVHYAGK
jgi:hypothetical protein